MTKKRYDTYITAYPDHSVEVLNDYASKGWELFKVFHYSEKEKYIFIFQKCDCEGAAIHRGCDD